MEKQTRDFKVKHELDWEYEVSIERLEEDIKELKKLGVTKVEIEANMYYDCAHLSINPICHRTETDEEHEERTGEIKRREDDTRRVELDQLALLKLKYDK